MKKMNTLKKLVRNPSTLRIRQELPLVALVKILVKCLRILEKTSKEKV